MQHINVLDMNKLFPARPCPSHLSGLNLLGQRELCILPNLWDTDQVILEYRPKQAWWIGYGIYFLSRTEYATTITRHTHALRFQLSDLRTSYCQCFISSPPNWHFICIPASLKIEHLGKTMTGSLAVVTSHSRTSLMPLTGLLPITDTPPPPPPSLTIKQPEST